MSTYTYTKDWKVEDILEKAKELEGKSLGEIDLSNWLMKGGNKGRVGNMIQSDFFGIEPNSDREADFKHHGIELKVTPVKRKRKDGFSSKERLVLGMINYNEDYKLAFENSIPNKKTKNTLLIFYLHEENQPVNTFKILKTILFKLPESDLPQVKVDYENILMMIREGRAHELSEKQQKFMSACTKGQGKGKDWVKQPFSKELAKSRAYSYKVGYMSAYFRTIMTPNEIEKICFPKELSFEENVELTFNKYIGKTAEDIAKSINYSGSSKDKSYLAKITNKLFGDHTKTNVNNTEEFQKNGYAIKIVTDRFYTSKNQDMSFQNLDFTEIQFEKFEDSSWYGLFAETKYIVAVWKEYEENKYRLLRYIYWTPDQYFISQAEKIYNHIQNMLLKDKIVITKDRSWKDNLPKKNCIKPFQIRPKGTKQNSCVTLPNGQVIKKKTFYIDKEYIRNIVGL